jgi:hypothetical protein
VPLVLQETASALFLDERADSVQGLGVPIYFLHFRRAMGATSIQVQRGSIDSGDFLESDATYLP